MASADSGFGISDALSDIIKNGIDKFLVGTADNLYEQSYRPDGTETFNGTGTEIWIYQITTHTTDPWKQPSIIKFLKQTLLILIIYCFVYSITGGIYVLASMLSPVSADLIDSMLNRSNAFRTVRIKEYFYNLLVSIGVVGFTITVMKMLFTLNYFMTSFFIVSCFQMKSLSPSSDNAILYLSIAMFYNILNGVMMLRMLLLCMFVMSAFIIGILLISNKTRAIGFTIGYYFIGILFLQSIIVFLTTAGFIAIEVVCAELGIITGSIVELVWYFILLFILVLASISIVIGLVRFKKAAIKTIRLVI